MTKTEVLKGDVNQIFDWLIKEAAKSEKPHFVYDALSEIVHDLEILNKYEIMQKQKYYFSTKDFCLYHPTSISARYYMFEKEKEFYAIVLDTTWKIEIYKINTEDGDYEKFCKAQDTFGQTCWKTEHLEECFPEF